jgi:DNA replication protein DnaC
MSALRRLDASDNDWQPEQAREGQHPEGEHMAPEEWEQPTEPRCPECDGVGWFRPRLPLDHPDTRKLIPCRCTQAKRTRKRIAQLREMSNLEAFHDKTFATFNQFAPGLQVAYQRAQAFVQQPNSWLTLLGPCGCGKTHLSAAIAAALANPEDALVVEGWAAFDPELEGIAVFATFVTTKLTRGEQKRRSAGEEAPR